MTLRLTLKNAPVLTPDGWAVAPLSLQDGLITTEPQDRCVDLSGYRLLPGIVDPHGDGFERHMAPRRGALRERDSGIRAVAAELAANGITTACLAQFWSWEGGMRGPDFAEEVFEAVTTAGATVPVDLRLQLRLETHYTDSFPRAEAALERFGINYLVFNDHLPHKRLSEGRRPPRLTGQALKSGRNPEDHLALMQQLHAQGEAVETELDALANRLTAKGIILGSHDDHTAQDRARWRSRGAKVSEFPETVEAAQAALDANEPVVLGAPNVVRGASHAGNASALDLIAEGLCDALASDYHYPSPARAAWRCVELGLLNEAKAWSMVSSGPAKLLGLKDRGSLTPGKRADLIVMDPDRQIVATIAKGEIAWLNGPVAHRFLA